MTKARATTERKRSRALENERNGTTDGKDENKYFGDCVCVF